MYEKGDDLLTMSDKFGRPLTNRELQVVELVAQGKRNKEIANVLEIAPDTVEKHLSSICAKYGVNGRVNVALYYLNWLRNRKI